MNEDLATAGTIWPREKINYLFYGYVSGTHAQVFAKHLFLEAKKQRKKVGREKGVWKEVQRARRIEVPRWQGLNYSSGLPFPRGRFLLCGLIGSFLYGSGAQRRR